MTLAHIELGGSMRTRPGSAFAHGAVEALLRALAERKTRRELDRLDDRLFADIGLARSDIEVAAAEASRNPSRGAPLWTRLVGRFLRARARARTIRELARLPDHILADIGIGRWEIAEAAEGLLAGRSLGIEASQPARGELSPVHDLLARVEAAVRPFRRWQMSRVAAGQLARLDRDTLLDLGYVKGDIDWVPEVLAERRLKPAANRNVARESVA